VLKIVSFGDCTCFGTEKKAVANFEIIKSSQRRITFHFPMDDIEKLMKLMSLTGFGVE
jgi:hypothetical protein